MKNFFVLCGLVILETAPMEDPDNLTDTCSSSADDFPEFLTEHARTHGGIVLCFLIGIYCFTLLAVVCDSYFLPCVETICDVLHLTPDVAAATFMSVATSCPELFTNIIGTFVTESDIGIGTIVVEDLQEKDDKPDTARVSVISAYGTYLEEAHKPGYDLQHEKILKKIDEEDKEEAQKSLFRIPEGKLYKKIFFFYSWPIQFILRCTIPNPKVYRKLFPLTFVMCIVWIGTNAYMVSWMMSNIGSVFKIPDAVLGLTFLAAGGSLPESISMAIISRRGKYFFSNVI
ncbi:hypothetical protein NQ314_009629 [Rhamnusium bicolor]|uniref:Sodium/calcium exchanger membrane region domain-containing protein n=1 Tax=Rhamnusium bicolor TaxID=1586634 RepID=A0AAV8XY55_9CUCU|nr:hypothetical protein NQ314_009629 [Rhamnusium bicolor]